MDTPVRTYEVWCLVFRGLVTVWLHVDRGGVTGSGGPGNGTKLLVGTGLSTPFSFTWSFVDCQVCHGHRACVHSGCAAGRRGQRGCRGDGRPDRVRARVLDGMAGGTGPAGPAGRTARRGRDHPRAAGSAGRA